MLFTAPLISGMLAKRYKRFLADVVLDSGEMVTAHVANPGAMMGLEQPFSRVWLSKSENPMRKLSYTWELIEVDLGSGLELVGVNTSQPNSLVAEALDAGIVPELRNYVSIRREVKYGANSRVDFLLEDPARRPCYVEVKNVHLMRQARLAEFPDCVTDRGSKHLEELSAIVASGSRAVMIYVIQIQSADRFTVARDLDPDYAEAFARARNKGVQMLAWHCTVNIGGIEMAAPVPVLGE